jgi:hypothetical protein
MRIEGWLKVCQDLFEKRGETEPLPLGLCGAGAGVPAQILH